MPSHRRTAILAPVRALALVFVLPLAPAAAAQGIYKWVDEDGVTQYTQQPPASGNAQLIDPDRSSRSPEPPQAQEADASAEDEDTGDGDSELPSSMSEYCEEMRERADTLAGDAPLQIQQDNGDLQELTDDQRAERLERARSQIEQHCADESA